MQASTDKGPARRMSRLIDDLLKFSRLHYGGMNFEIVDLSAIAAGIAAGLRDGDPARRAEFILEKGISTCGDAGLLRTALENLFANAWKFTSRTPQAIIEFGIDRQDGAPVFFVRDNGAGFDMAYAEKLFNPFQRLHSYEEFPGTGIGLATVHRIILRHGGKIWAEGAIGEGAVVYFTLGDIVAHRTSE
jgi:light-regulated signal transduction histidine kinase (bacteriophytochrome)